MIGKDDQTLKELIRFGLPTIRYLKFVNNLLQRSSQYFVDPFVVDLRNFPVEEEASFIDRRGIMDHMPGSRVIVGGPGAGKTRLFRRLLPKGTINPSRTLAVALSMEAFAQEGEIQGGRMSSVSLDRLNQLIFETYWRDYILRPVQRAYHPGPFRSREWLLRLHWFYHHYPPTWLEIPREPELSAWLATDLSPRPIRQDLPAEKALSLLIQMITSEPVDLPLSAAQEMKTIPYERIEILIDGTENLSEYAVSRLICDVQQLYELNLAVKLFLDPIYEKQLENLACYWQGRISLSRLPEWTSDELREMLEQRWIVFKQGEVNGSWESDLTNFLEPSLCGRLIDIIVTEAMKREKNASGGQSAPVHALKLARGLLAACAGCFVSDGISLPIRTEHVETLLRAYWAG